MNATPSASASRLLVYGCFGLGVVLRTIQYGARASLWLDELAVAHTVVARDLVRLTTEPLAYYQVAPAGFLALQRIAITALGSNEIGFRAVPWLASIAALFVFWRIAARLLPRTPALMALALFASSPAFIAYGSQAKQYSTDVLAVLCLLWAGTSLVRAESRPWLPMLAGSFGLLVSLPAVLAGAAIGSVLLARTIRGNAPARRVLVLTAVCWTAAAAVTVILARLTLSPETSAYMQAFWANAFPPAAWTLPGLIVWTGRMLGETLAFATYFFLPSDVPVLALLALVLCSFAIYGVWWFGSTNGTHAALVVSPIVAAIMAAVAHLMPLSGRVSLWLGPLLLLLSAAGVAALATVPTRSRLALQAGVAGVFPVAGIVALLADPPPYRSQDLRPVLEQVAIQAQPSDAIYVYYGARHAMRFYGPRLGFTRWTEGNCHRGDPVAYFRELDVFRGKDRVWVIWTHALERHGEPKAIRSYLSAIGTERARINASEGEDSQDSAQALLYDLSVREKLSTTTAERHPIPPPDRPNAGRPVPCGGPANDATVVH